MPELALQLSLMALEAALAAAVLLALFTTRRILGLAALYTTVGVFYYLATLLASTTFVGVAPGLLASPGSVALFPASLFAVLLVYIREDAQEARNMIYGLLAANLSASLLGLVVAQHLRSPLAVNPLSLPPELFVQSPRLFLVGTLALFADTILIILAYEALSRVLRPLFLRAWASLALVLALDTLLFVTGGFVEHPAYRQILLAGVLGKAAAAVVYAAALSLYLPHARAAEAPAGGEARPGLGDLFQVLTYRQKYEALRAQAARDPLTGLYNRGFFDEMLQAQLAQARRGGSPFTVLIVDVDHFKRINDSHGHFEGDRALRVIAQALVGVARASDIVCRYGGEEFCLILAGTPLDSASQLASRIREEVPAACARAGVGAGTRVTVTIGLAACPGDGRETDALMRAADARLYLGKQAGRDRVVAA
ncbi:MAG: diguanylate cyclase [Betaproteobacteria bacterium]|nr:MAG: diguanylate cyclase [Betaproteobacteria bacterium]